MSQKKVIINTIYYGIIPKLTILINMFILPIITPFLSTYDYGIHGVITSYTSMMISIAPLGLNLHLTNSYFEIPNNYRLVWGRILMLFIFSAILCGLVSCFILYTVLPLKSSFILAFLCFFGSLPIFLFPYSTLSEHLYPLLETPKPLVFTNLIASLCGICVSFVLIYYYRLGFWGLLATPAVSCAISFLIFGYHFRYSFNIIPILENNVRRLKSLFKTALPLVPHTLGFMLLTSSARIVMSLYNLDYDDIGLFSHGCTMGGYVAIITTALVTAISPQMQRSYRSHNYIQYRKLYYLCQGVAIMSSFLFCLWMNDIYDVLIHNEQLSKSSVIAMIMCFAQVQMPLYYFMSISCFVERNTKQLLWLVFVPGILNLSICYFLIPLYGYKVAIYSTIISYWSQVFIPFFIPYFKSRTQLWLKHSAFLLALLLVFVISLFLASLLSNCFVAIKLLVTILLLFISYYIFRHYQIEI